MNTPWWAWLAIAAAWASAVVVIAAWFWAASPRRDVVEPDPLWRERLLLRQLELELGRALLPAVAAAAAAMGEWQRNFASMLPVAKKAAETLHRGWPR